MRLKLKLSLLDIWPKPHQCIDEETAVREIMVEECTLFHIRPSVGFVAKQGGLVDFVQVCLDQRGIDQLILIVLEVHPSGVIYC